VTSLDLTESIAPRSDQLNAEDMLTGPRTFTISEVRKGSSAEQPFDFHLAEFPGRPFKPSKTVRRILVHAWGADAAAYAGRRLTLFRDPDVRFGGQSVGGIRVSHLSHIDKQFTIALTETRGKRASHVVKPLGDEPTPPNRATAGRPRIKPNVEALIENAQEARHNADLDDVARAAAGLTGDELDAVKAAVVARRAELKEATTEPPADGWPEVATIPGMDES